MQRIATPETTRGMLKKYDFQIRKSLGQNFLVESNYIDQIIEAAQLAKDAVVVEIGPGMGALTQSLAKAAGLVAAVELDQSLVKILSKNFAAVSNLTVVHGDALKTDFNALVQELPEREKYRPAYQIIANLPYYITTPLIMRVLEGDYDYSAMILMVQKEVAYRMLANPGTKDYGALSIGVQYRCTPSLVTLVPNTAFYPRPEVESAVIRLEKRLAPPVQVDNEALMFSLVRAGFGQRRKTFLNALRGSGLNYTKEDWEVFLGDCAIDPVRRGETLSIAEFAALANRISREIK